MWNLSKLLRSRRAARRRADNQEKGRYRPTLDALEERCLLTGPQPLPVIQLQPVLTGLSNPLLATNAGDGSNRLFVVEQRGVIRVRQPGAGTTSVFLNLSGVTVDGVPGLARVRSPGAGGGNEQGLLGVAFHPQYATNGRFFLHYTTNTAGASGTPVNQIAEYQVDPNNANVALPDETLILRFPAQPFGNHNGGAIEFANDGYLYIGKGDGGSGDDPGNRAQDRRATVAAVNNENSWFGKIHRIDINGGDQFPADPNRNYSIPSSNPFVGALVSGPLGTEPLQPAREEIYAYGVRNPFRFSFDRLTGQLYLGNVGQNAREEIEIIVSGGNFGWRTWEGTRLNFPGDPLASNPGAVIFPIAEYGNAAPGGSRSVTGGQVYRGTQSALPYGSYIFGDFVGGQLYVLVNGTRLQLAQTLANPSSFGLDEDGEIYITSFNGTLQRVTNPSIGVRILDNGGADFATTPNFFPFAAQGFANDVHFAAAGAGGETATWTFNNLTPGRYRVSATWSIHPNRATNSPFSVYDGAADPGNLLGTTALNQELNPNSLSERGVLWQDLGTGSFNITGTTLTVQLTDNANEYVIADAVRIERVSDAGSPEIVVQLDDLTDVADETGVVNYGNRNVLSPLTRTYTVRNVGGSDLTLADLAANGGFSIAANFGVGSLAPGASTTFQIQMDAAALGLFNGTVSFTTNDASEAAYNFAVVGTAGGSTFVQVIDDGDPGFSQTGFTAFPGLGFGGDTFFSFSGTGVQPAEPVAGPPGNAPGFATWTFTGLTPGLYRISATWVEHPNRATNAPFVIFDDNVLLDQVLINQELAPSDFTAGGSWKNLGGPYFINSGTIVVRLANNANEYVIADAIRIERLATDPTQIIDDSDGGPGFTATPGFTPFQFQGFKNNVTFAAAGSGAEVASWTFSGLVSGTYQVAVTWTPHPNRATDAPFAVDGGGPILLNQEQSPGDFNASGASWRILGNFTVSGGGLLVQLSDFANEYVIADAVRIERLT